MTFDNLTPVDAQRIADALEKLAQFKQSQAQADIQTRKDIVEAWWNTVKPNTPTTRTEAMDAIVLIKNLIKTETDPDRLGLLRNKLREADIKYHDVKETNPHS